LVFTYAEWDAFVERRRRRSRTFGWRGADVLAMSQGFIGEQA
jgi:hypothetical protein